MPIPKLNRRDTRQYGHIQLNEQKPTNTPKKKKGGSFFKKRKWLKIVTIIAIACFSVGIISISATVIWVTKDLPSPDKLIERKVSQSTKIYDRTGKNLLYEIYQDQKRTLIELEEISDYAKKATVAIEDKHFYTHKGIRVQSILRATVNNLLGRRSGGGGASTLTQQLIKNAVVGDDRSYFRKIKEAILAIQLEKKYDKDQILKMYLNEIPYGSTNYGIEAASQSYFKKKAKNLTLAEAATLAALPQASTRYLNDLEALANRRDVVLKLMFDQGYITEQEKNLAQNTALSLYQNTGKLEAPHFVLYVKQLLADSFGEKTVDEGGLKVITTLDYEKQKIAEKAVEEIGKINAEKYKANNAALVALDPKTGEVLSMVGSRDFANDKINGKFNVAVLGKRQPGSSFKPLIYAAAFAKGYTPQTVVYDVLTDFGKNSNKKYIPKNYSGKDYGLVTLGSALQGSLNIAAVKTLYLVGVERAMDFAKKFGYTTLTGDYGLSLVLGGAEVTLYEHTAAFAALANNGEYNKPYTIINVTDSKGKELYKVKKPKSKEVLDKDVAKLMSTILSDDNARAYMFGTGSNLTLPGRPVAAKTGTTDDAKDAWTVGYTPSLVAGVWVGNSIPSAMSGGGSMLAAPIWNKFMRESLKDSAVEQFEKPEKKTEIKNPFLQGSMGGIKIGVNKKTGKIASSSTPDEFVVEKTYLPPHSLLHYINKDDPNTAGGSSQNDPQYKIWEDALQEWISKQQLGGNNITLADPPTEYDSPQDAKLIPTIKVISPTPSSTVTSRQLQFKITASAPRGVSEVNYYLNGKKVGSSKSSPFSISYYAQKESRGKNMVKITAEDDKGNMAIEEFYFTLDAELDPPTFSWLDTSPLSLTKDNFPYIIFTIPFRWSDTKNIKVYLEKTGESSKLIYTFNQSEVLFGDKLKFTWNTHPGIGQYKLKGVLVDKNNRTTEKTLNVVVK